MKQSLTTYWAWSLAALLTGCAASIITLAPGADRVRVTKDPTAVAACTGIGNVDARQFLNHPDAYRAMQNQTVGLGGNGLFVTFDPGDHLINSVGSSATGIAYVCPTNAPATK